MQSKFLHMGIKHTECLFWAPPQDFLKGWSGRNYKLPAGQEVGFPKTNKKISTLSKAKNILIATNQKGQKQIYNQTVPFC